MLIFTVIWNPRQSFHGFVHHVCLPQYDESDSDLETELMEPTVETLPIITDVLNDPISGVRIVNHNIQGLLSKSTDVLMVGIMC